MTEEKNGVPVAVLGGGAWGCTAADLLARNGATVRLWDIKRENLENIAKNRHPFGVPELSLHESVALEPSLADALQGARFAVVAIPSQAVGSLTKQLREALDGAAPPAVVLLSKGIDIETLRPLSDVVGDGLPDATVAVVSGPCIAREVARRMPTSVVAACDDAPCAVATRDLFTTPYLRVYTQDDILGVELGGALKNVIAIAAGIGDGLGFGENSKSALLARGLAEMTRLAVRLGAQPTTLYGLAGLGDLAVTCFSPHSRNRTFGEHLGKGRSAEEARDAVGMTVEGEPTARATLALAEREGLALPITEAVVRVCEGEWTAQQAVEELMRRELKEEF